MTPTRREFLWTMGAAALVLQQAQDIFWTTEGDTEDPGWAPGLENRRTSACLICPARCGIQGRMVDGRLVRILGNPLHPMSRGGVCPRGLAGMQMLYHPERLASPLVRVGSRGTGQWQTVSQEGAITLVTERLQDLRTAGRPEALAVLGGYCAGTMSDLWHRFLQAYGSPNYVADDYDDGTDAIMALMHGIPRRPSYDLERAELAVSFGAPLFESWWSPLQAFVAFASPEGEAARRPRFIQVDTRFSRTAARAHEWVGIRPGTHGVLALGIAYILIRDELYDAEFITQHVSGFEDFTDAEGRPQEGYRSRVMRHYRTEEVSAITGVPVERITALARVFAASRPAVAVCGSDVMLAPNGLLAGLAVHSLNVLTGSVNRPGGVLFGDEPPLEPLASLVQDETSRAGLAQDRVVGAPAPFGGRDQASRFAEAVAANADPKVEALFLYYANPLASSAHPEAWRDALDKIPFVVSFSPFLDETTRQADVILPDLLPYERWQDAPTPTSYPYPVWGLARPLVEPRAGGTHTGDAVLALAQRLGGSIAQSLPYGNFQELLKARARGLFAARRGMTLGDEFERQHHRQMEERGWWLPEHTDFEAFWEELLERGGWADLFYDDTDPARLARTPNGRIDLLPASLLRVLETEQRELRPYVTVGLEGSAPSDFPLRLIPYRVSTLASGTLALERWLVEQPSILPRVHWVPWVEVAPATARELGFADGAMVRVVSRRGQYRARLRVFPGTAPENVCAPYGLRHPNGDVASPLQLLAGAGDPETGLPSWFSTFVRLEAV
ncbi:MAG: molybdopterin-dependent oxidoreductase [Gemmatimonadales bacterium]|nr:molybdopterin-dependent oxidoreductase [Gemmatimonadales bacterium]NIN48681.1 molybdopterin-dependent oxidoreductase [Gemmatimonadales bacterium]NIP06145.1 molybdopterin-dependent oxidoreductase [Gemmatimonadales bacterium]NIR01319.1 molybdopterin-dependent oxidoreductase [Gemmatimonadales bacterium]